LNRVSASLAARSFRWHAYLVQASGQFTAFRQHVLTKDYRLVRTFELENGSYLYDLNIQRGGTGSGLWDVTNRKNYLLAPLVVSIPKRNSAH